MDRNAGVKASCRITHKGSLAVPCSHTGMAPPPAYTHSLNPHTHLQRHIRLMAIIGLMPPDILLVPECDRGGGCQLLGTPMPSPAPPGWSVQIPHSPSPSLSLPKPGKTPRVCSLCQLSCINGGEGLMLKLTDCLHLLSELCHMLECTSWLLLGERRCPPLPSRLFFKWRAMLTLLPSWVTAIGLPPTTLVQLKVYGRVTLIVPHIH